MLPRRHVCFHSSLRFVFSSRPDVPPYMDHLPGDWPKYLLFDSNLKAGVVQDEFSSVCEITNPARIQPASNVSATVDFRNFEVIHGGLVGSSMFSMTDKVTHRNEWPALII